MTTAQPTCPSCQQALALTAQGDFDPWVCPSGHGLAATLSEGYERMQEDELALLWAHAREGAAGQRRCPICERPMTAVALGYDSDEVPEGQPGDGPDEGSVDLDVCPRCQLIWFDTGELDALPADRPDAEPTAEEQARIAEIRSTFGQSIDAAFDAEHRDELGERLYRHLSDHPRLVSLLTRRSSATNA